MHFIVNNIKFNATKLAWPSDLSTTNNAPFAAEIRSLIESGGHRCSICGKAFRPYGVFFAGKISGDKAALTRACCRAKLRSVLFVGLYRPTSTLSTALSILRRGGSSPTPETLVDTASNRWKRDDAAWFKANPSLAHRLRPLLPDEAQTLPFDVRNVAIPAHLEIRVIIRQVEPGQRIRRFVVQNRTAKEPDTEEMLHVLFDLAGQELGDPRITIQDLEKGARKWTSGKSPH